MIDNETFAAQVCYLYYELRLSIVDIANHYHIERKFIDDVLYKHHEKTGLPLDNSTGAIFNFFKEKGIKTITLNEVMKYRLSSNYMTDILRRIDFLENNDIVEQIPRSIYMNSNRFIRYAKRRLPEMSDPDIIKLIENLGNTHSAARSQYTERYDKFIEMYKKGMPMSCIAKALDVSESTVYNYKNAYERSTNTHKPYGPERYKIIAEMTKNGMSKEEIAKRLGTTIKSVHSGVSRLKKMGIVDKDYHPKNKYTHKEIEGIISMIDSFIPFKDIMKTSGVSHTYLNKIFKMHMDKIGIDRGAYRRYKKLYKNLNSSNEVDKIDNPLKFVMSI